MNNKTSLPSKTQSKEAECAFCEKIQILQRSHITPKFAYRRLKESTPDHTFDHFVEIKKTEDNQIIERKTQKEVTVHLLCSSCEQNIGSFEQFFTNTICLNIRKNGDFYINLENKDNKLDKIFKFLLRKPKAVEKYNLSSLQSSEENLNFFDEKIKLFALSYLLRYYEASRRALIENQQGAVELLNIKSVLDIFKELKIILSSYNIKTIQTAIENHKSFFQKIICLKVVANPREPMNANLVVYPTINVLEGVVSSHFIICGVWFNLIFAENKLMNYLYQAYYLESLMTNSILITSAYNFPKIEDLIESFFREDT